MREFFENAYRTGFLPWEESAKADHSGAFERLLARETAEHEQPRRAVDLGCGRGFQARMLATAGWEVVGIDYIPGAIEQAKIGTEGSAAKFVVGDVTDLQSSVTGSFDFFLDVGCFHCLTGADRAAYGRGVGAVAAPGATLLLLAMTPGAPFPAPPGAKVGDVEAALGDGWQTIDDIQVPTEQIPTVPSGVEVHFHRFRRV